MPRVDESFCSWSTYFDYFLFYFFFLSAASCGTEKVSKDGVLIRHPPDSHTSHGLHSSTGHAVLQASACCISAPPPHHSFSCGPLCFEFFSNRSNWRRQTLNKTLVQERILGCDRRPSFRSIRLPGGSERGGERSRHRSSTPPTGRTCWEFIHFGALPASISNRTGGRNVTKFVVVKCS